MEKNIFDDFVDINKDEYKSSSNNHESDYKPLNQNIDIIQACAITSEMKYEPVFSNMRTGLFSFYYNNFGHNNKFEYKNSNKIMIKPITIFKKIFNIYDEKSKSQNLKVFNTFINQNFLYMSYRFNFPFLYSSSGQKLTDDCGWGCIIRCCQMLLCSCIIQNKVYNFKMSHHIHSTLKLKNEIYDQIKRETLFLFYDNYIPKNLVLNNSDFSFFWDKLKIKNENDINYFGLKSVMAPFSIQIICKLINNPGNYTSDVKVINAFIEINKQFFNNKYVMLYLPGCNISIKTLYENFCELKKCNCVKENNNLCEKCYEELINSENNKKNKKNFFYYEKNIYEFKKGGFIFLSFRFGYNTIDKSLITIIPNILLKISGNVGFVGGKDNRAYYFFGIGNQKLLCLDPHMNQKAIEVNNRFNNDNRSYEVNDVYMINFEDLSSEMSMGVVINNENDLIEFIEDMKVLKDKYPLNFNLS